MYVYIERQQIPLTVHDNVQLHYLHDTWSTLEQFRDGNTVTYSPRSRTRFRMLFSRYVTVVYFENIFVCKSCGHTVFTGALVLGEVADRVAPQDARRIRSEARFKMQANKKFTRIKF